MNEDDLKYVSECEKEAERVPKGPWKLWGMDVYADPKNTSNLADGVLVAKTFCNYGDFQRTFVASFIAKAVEAVPRLCRMLREQDKRARHAEQERDAFDKRIGELEAEVAKFKPDAEAWRKGHEVLHELRERVIPCGHRIEDLIGGTGSVTKCGACLATKQKAKPENPWAVASSPRLAMCGKCKGTGDSFFAPNEYCDVCHGERFIPSKGSL